MKDPYEAYGSLACTAESATVKAGRRNIQADDEKRVPADVAEKLGLLPAHTLLEIGCGPGAILCPLSKKVAHATGIDHPDVIAVARAQCKSVNVTFIAGQFPAVGIKEKFDRVLAYSVLHYMPDMSAVEKFIDAATALLKPCGKLLLGDLPNADNTRRFRESEMGKAFEVAWRARMAGELKGGDPFEIFADANMLRTFDDEKIVHLVARYRKAGFNVYILPQSPDLPAGYTREDMLISLP